MTGLAMALAYAQRTDEGGLLPNPMSLDNDLKTTDLNTAYTWLPEEG